MPSYLVQKRIHTLLEYVIHNEAVLSPFTRKDIRFSSWEPDFSTAWRSRFWLTECDIESVNFTEAWKVFQGSLTEVVSRIAFVGQAYHTDLAQPYLIRKTDSEIAYFRYSQDRSPVPLGFSHEELRSLDALLNDATVPDEFYLYWNDAINALGYTAKLLLMFAALEALFEKGSRNNSEYYSRIQTVFGADLKKELFGTPEDSGKSGLRQRLVHGEHLSEKDTKNYVEVIHKHIIRYFNANLLHDSPIDENIVSPQRHPYGNLEGWQGFIRSEAGAPLSLKAVVAAFDADANNPAGYEIVPPDERPQIY